MKKATLNTDFSLPKPEVLAYLRKKFLQSDQLTSYYISSQDDEEWIAYREKMNQVIIDINQSKKH